MQYRIWSKLHANGMHTDLDKPPNNSTFKRAGANTPSTKKKRSDSTSPEMAQALTQAATQVSSAIVAKRCYNGDTKEACLIIESDRCIQTITLL